MAHFVFHLVHGTQFYLLARPRLRWLGFGKPAVRWTKPGSPLRSNMRTFLEEEGHTVNFRVVDWTGRNRHGARLEAARRICQSIAESPEDARNIVVAHSHGGNACMLALKEAEKSELEHAKSAASGAEGAESSATRSSCCQGLPRRLAGIVCLSTPFLVVRKAEWALNATIAWFTVVFLGLNFVANAQFDSLLAVITLGGLGGVILAVPFGMAARRYKNWKEWSQTPTRCDVPVLIVRSPGDEASSGLGFVAILARMVFLLEYKAAWPLRWLQRHPVRLWLGGTAVLLAVLFALVLIPGFEAWLSDYWILLLLVLFAPLLLGLPIRVLVYGLAYGPDLLGLPMFQSISAETTPLGQWITQLVEPPDAEERSSAHSEIYHLEGVHELMVAWAQETITTGGNAVA